MQRGSVVLFFPAGVEEGFPKGRQLLGPLQLIQIAATFLSSVQCPLCRCCCWESNKASRTFSWGINWMQISQITAASGQGLNCAVRTADLLCTEKWELFMTLCGFCLENVSVLDAAWPSSGHNPISTSLQRGSVPVLHSTWICPAFVSREVHF